jgi:hypothetical protein
MTVEATPNLNTCSQCGSAMSYRKRRLSTGDVVTIKICRVCRHFENVEDMD